MKKQQYLWLSLLISFILSYSSCKKKDFEEINRADSNRLSEGISKQKFFNHHDDLDSQVVNIIKDLRRQDTIFNFVEHFIEKNGYPIWNLTDGNYHANINGLALENSLGTTTTDTLLYFIPFKRTDVKSVNTIIACTQVGNKYSYKLLKRQYYEYRVLTLSTFNSFDRSALAVFAYFEQRVNHIDSIELGYFKNV